MNFNMNKWSSTYRWEIFEKGHDDDYNYAQLILLMDNSDSWAFELWLKREEQMVFIFLIASFCALFLLKFKGNYLFSDQNDDEKKDFLRSNRDLVQTAMDLSIAETKYIIGVNCDYWNWDYIPNTNFCGRNIHYLGFLRILLFAIYVLLPRAYEHRNS